MHYHRAAGKGDIEHPSRELNLEPWGNTADALPPSCLNRWYHQFAKFVCSVCTSEHGQSPLTSPLRSGRGGGGAVMVVMVHQVWHFSPFSSRFNFPSTLQFKFVLYISHSDNTPEDCVAVLSYFDTGAPYVGPSTVLRHIFVLQLYNLNLNWAKRKKIWQIDPADDLVTSKRCYRFVELSIVLFLLMRTLKKSGKTFILSK